MLCVGGSISQVLSGELGGRGNWKLRGGGFVGVTWCHSVVLNEDKKGILSASLKEQQIVLRGRFFSRLVQVMNLLMHL